MLTTQVSISMLVDEFMRYGEQEWSETTIRPRATHMKQLAEALSEQGVYSPSELSFAAIQAHIAIYAQTHAQTTTNTHKRIIKVFLSWLYSYKEIDLSVRASHIRTRNNHSTIPKSISNDTIRRAIEYAKYQDGVIIRLLAESGIRIRELFKLKWYDLEGNTLLIHGKGNIDRIVYVSPELARDLSSIRHGTSGEMFYNVKYDRDFTLESLRLHIERCFQTVGVHVTPHQLRHTFAINLLENGCDLVTIQRLLGHRYITTTQEYLRVKNDFIRGQYEKYANIY